MYRMMESQIPSGQEIGELRHEMKALHVALRAEIQKAKRTWIPLEERTRGHFTLLQWILGFNLLRYKCNRGFWK
jgi:hypothetical protein